MWWVGRLMPISPPPSPLDFDRQRYEARRGVSWRGSGEVWLREPASAYVLWWRQLREGLYQRLLERGEEGRVILGLTLGDSTSISPEIKGRLTRGGLGHLLAVSGLHIGAFALLLAWLIKRVSIYLGSHCPYLWGAWAAICGAWLFVELAQWPLSAQRAAWMITLFFGAQICRTQVSVSTSLIVAGWILTLKHPSLSSELGFQLSFCAVYGLCMCSPAPISPAHRSERPRSKSRGAKIKQGTQQLLITSSGASVVTWLMTSPVQAWHLGTFSPWSPLINLIFTPLASLFLIPISLFGALSSGWIETPLICACWCVKWSLKCMSALPDLFFTQEIVGQWMMIPLSLLALCWSLWLQSRRLDPKVRVVQILSRYYVIDPSPRMSLFAAEIASRICQRLSLLCIFLVLLSFKWVQDKAVLPPQVTMLYVGQGDSTLLANGEGRYALFDVGTAYGGRSVLSLLKRLGIDRLEWIGISHLHPDHYGGLEVILGELEVGQVLYHGRDHPRSPSPFTSRVESPSSPSSPSAKSTVRSHQRRVTWESVSQKLQTLSIPLTTPLQRHERWGALELRWMLANPSAHLSENDSSIALLIQRADPSPSPSLLLSGDLEKRGEARLREEWREMTSTSTGLKRSSGSLKTGRSTPRLHSLRSLTVWHINHHGSDTSTHSETLAVLRPRTALLSLGWHNRFRFPHPEVISRLAGRGISRWRADLDGHVSVCFTWKGLSIWTQGEGLRSW